MVQYRHGCDCSISELNKTLASSQQYTMGVTTFLHQRLRHMYSRGELVLGCRPSRLLSLLYQMRSLFSYSSCRGDTAVTSRVLSDASASSHCLPTAACHYPSPFPVRPLPGKLKNLPFSYFVFLPRCRQRRRREKGLETLLLIKNTVF